MSDEIKTPEANYTLQRLKAVLGKAGAMFGDISQHFRPVYYTLLTEIENEIVPDAAQALEAEIQAIEQHAIEAIEGVKAKLIAAINAHIQQVAPSKLNILYPPVSESLNQVSPLAVSPAPQPADSGHASPAGDDLPAIDSGEPPQAATPKTRRGGRTKD